MKTRDFNLKFSRVLIICLIVAVLTASIVYATVPQPFTINRGVYPSGVNTFWEEDGIYYEKNAYGVIEYSGTNAAAVINSAIGLGNKEIFLSAGIIEISQAIILQPNLKFRGAGIGVTILQQTADISGIIRGGSIALGIAPPQNVTISDLTLIGQLGGADTGNGIDFTEAIGISPKNIILENLAIQNIKNNAIFGYHADNFQISKITINGATQGIGFNGLTNSSISQVTIINCSSYGLDLSYTRGVNVGDVQLTGQNTALKIDDGSTSAERSQYINLNNLYIFDSWGTYDSLAIWGADHIQINNFQVFSGSANQAVRLDQTVNNVTLSNGYIETTDASVTTGLYNKAPQSSFSNIRILHRNTGYWALLAETTSYNSTYLNIDTYSNTLGIKNSEPGSQIHLSWNSTSWIT